MKKNIYEKVEKITYITPPSPVVLVSTVSKEGITNIAPFAMFMMASSRPPMITLGISPKSDTFRNICDTKEFVVAFPKKEFINQLYRCGEKLDSKVSEFDYFNIKSYRSNNIKPFKVADCCVNLECHLNWHQEAGNHYIICGEVIDADIDDDIYKLGITNAELRLGIDSIYHVTDSYFVTEFKKHINVDIEER